MRGATGNCGHEEIIKAAIQKLEQRSKEINVIIYANPYQEIVRLREQVKTAITACGYEASMNEITKAAKRERELLSLARKQKRHSSALILELIEVDMEIDDLKTELCKLTLPILMQA